MVSSSEEYWGSRVSSQEMATKISTRKRRRSRSLYIPTLGYAILSLLARTPLSGYDIAREMKRPTSFFFGHAQISQIYPELSRLEEYALVTSNIVEQQGKPDKKVYTISPTGLQEIQSW